MKAKDRTAVSTLRTVIAALDNAGAVPTVEGSSAIETSALGAGASDRPRRELTPDEERAVVNSEVADLKAAAVQYRSVERQDLAEQLEAQAELLGNFLQ